MESGLNISDFDYVTRDSSGIVGVKGKNKYPITKEDWDKAHPEHRTTDCKECEFVQDKETLLVFRIPREQRGQASVDPKFVGKFTMPGWAGHSAFYLFKCADCGETCVDYPHGYTGPGYLYLRCKSCDSQKVLNSRKYEEIYQMNGIPAPPSLFEMIKSLWKNRPTREERKRFRAQHLEAVSIRQEKEIQSLTGSPFIVTDPKNLSSGMVGTIETTDSDLSGYRIFSTLRKLGPEVVVWTLLAYALVYAFRYWIF